MFLSESCTWVSLNETDGCVTVTHTFFNGCTNNAPSAAVGCVDLPPARCSRPEASIANIAESLCLLCNFGGADLVSNTAETLMDALDCLDMEFCRANSRGEQKGREHEHCNTGSSAFF